MAKKITKPESSKEVIKRLAWMVTDLTDTLQDIHDSAVYDEGDDHPEDCAVIPRQWLLSDDHDRYADACGLTRRALYHHCHGKEDGSKEPRPFVGASKVA